MSLSEPRVQRLLEQAADRQAIAQLADDTYVRNDQLRALFHLRKQQDPGFNATELARRAGFSSGTAVERDLGLMRTSDTVSKGRHYRGALKNTVLVANAERLLRGMNRDPRDVEILLAGGELDPQLSPLQAMRPPRATEPPLQMPTHEQPRRGRKMRSSRRHVPENVPFGAPGIDISVFLRSSPEQWAGVLHLAQGVTRVTRLCLRGDIVEVEGELAGGRCRSRRILHDGTIKSARRRGAQ